MIKLDGKLLFEHWCMARGFLNPALFCELPDEQVLAWNALAVFLCRNEWESVDFAREKVLKVDTNDRSELREWYKKRLAEQAKLTEAYEKWREEAAQVTSDEVEKIRGEFAQAYSEHHKSCALRHGGIACTC